MAQTLATADTSPAEAFGKASGLFLTSCRDPFELWLVAGKEKNQVNDKRQGGDYRENLIDGGAEQADPIVRWLSRQWWHVAVHVVNFGTSVAAIERVPSVVAYCTPI